jgi:hypothetical protein
MEDFNKQPWAEICWYFTETQEQYRLSGKISVIDANAEDKAQRVSLSWILFEMIVIWLQLFHCCYIGAQ